MITLTSERLIASYGYDFSPEVLDRVDTVQAEQSTFSDYDRYIKAMGAVESNGISKHIDFRRFEEDPEATIVMHLSMANPLNPHNKFGVASVAGMFPNSRIIAFGNPAEIGSGYGVLKRRQREAVVRGDFRPAIDRVVRKLNQEKIHSVSHVGGSYGAELAMAAASVGDYYLTHNVVAIEPVTATKRRVAALGSDFLKSSKPMQGYMDANELGIFDEAIDQATGKISFGISLLRLTNISIARGLSEGNFRDHALAALGTAENLTVSWGTESELSTPELLQLECDKLVLKYGPKRIGTIAIQGGHHSMGNDLALQNAILAMAMPGLAQSVR